MTALLLALGCHAPTTCDRTATAIRCPREEAALDADGRTRDVFWQVPDGEPPAAGWPVAVLFQGTGFAAGTFWSAPRATPLVPQVELTAALLDAGVAVITPEAAGEGLTCWNTNVPPWAGAWGGSPDAALMASLFAGLEDGTFGEVDPDTLYAAGISSGGYMTSRVATTWPDRFAAVSIVAGSYATCVGPVCDIPDDAPLAGHPPTLFAHGALDPVVPIGTMRRYQERLDAIGAVTAVDERALGVHAWPSDAAELLVDWFLD